MDSKQTDTQKSGDSATKKSNQFDGFDFDGLELSMEAMLVAGVHFGHPKSRRNPKMQDFIFTTRDNVNIIDLAQTVDLFETALKFLAQTSASGKKILFVGTKKQTQSFVVDLADYTGNPYVIERWLGGTMTNFGNIRKRVKYMISLEQQFAADELGKYTKLERLKKQEELEKLTRRMGGIKGMDALPAAVFVSDIKADHLAIREARRLGIPVVGISDTNANPEEVDYPIPANDDALSSLRYIFAHIAKTVGKK